jgi:hypothetical protein
LQSRRAWLLYREEDGMKKKIFAAILLPGLAMSGAGADPGGGDHPYITVLQRGGNWVIDPQDEKDAGTDDSEAGFRWRVTEGYSLAISNPESTTGSDASIDQMLDLEHDCRINRNELRCGKKAREIIDHGRRYVYRLTVYQGGKAVAEVDPFIHFR